MILAVRKWPIQFQTLLLLVILFSLYGVFSQFFSGILPIHEWRKTDSLSIALNYAKGASFLEPQTQWISANGNRNAAAEFPIIYYLLGNIWNIVGYHEWISKVLSLSLLFMSISLFSEVMEFVLKNKQKALLFSLMMASSPVLIYYADTILPNIFAFSFLLLGAYGVFHFLKSKQVFWLGFFTLFLGLAVLLKITALISILTFGGAWVVYSILYHRQSFKEHAFFYLAFISSFALILTATFLWYRYAIHYNKAMGSDLFSTTIRPIWEVDADTRKAIWEQFWRHMLPGLYHPSLLLIAVLFFFYAAWKKWLSPFIICLVIIGFIGCLSYFILWFWVFDVHDYYLIEILFFPLLLFYLLFIGMDHLRMEKRSRISFSIIWIALVFLQAISYAHWSFGKENFITKNTPFVSQFVKGNWGYFHFYYKEHLGQLQSAVKDLQKIIPESDTVICLSDPSPNIQLYTLNRVGYSQYSFHEPFDDETLQLAEWMQKGANFALIITEANWEPRKDWEVFLHYPLYQKGNVRLFDLRPYKRKNKGSKPI